MTVEQLEARLVELGFRAWWAEEMEAEFPEGVIVNRCERAEEWRDGRYCDYDGSPKPSSPVG